MIKLLAIVAHPDDAGIFCGGTLAKHADRGDDVVFGSTFPEGDEFRTAVTFTFGEGRGAYIRPGHETVHIYHHPSIYRTLENTAFWADSRAPSGKVPRTPQNILFHASTRSSGEACTFPLRGSFRDPSRDDQSNESWARSSTEL